MRSDIQQLSEEMLLDILPVKGKNGRKLKKLFIAEGRKICFELLRSDYKIECVIVNSCETNDLGILNLLNQFNKKKIAIYQTTTKKFNKLCNAETPQGIFAIAKMKNDNDSIDNFQINIKNIQNKTKNTALFVALDNISDPGNVGTIIRTAEWFGIEQILFIGECANQYNPKVIRASAGSIFRMQIINLENSTDILDRFVGVNTDFDIYAASLDAKEFLHNIKPLKPFGLIVGNESRGISEFLNGIITDKFLIAGAKKAESLNVGIATGIALYHFCRY
jgi:TrmH family RNA methyltransferase